MEIYKKNLIIKLKDVKNEIRYIQWKWGGEDETLKNASDKIREKKRLDFILEVKEKIKGEIMHYKQAYICIDELFIREIKYVDRYRKWNSWFMCWNIKKPKHLYNNTNPVINDYLNAIFADD